MSTLTGPWLTYSTLWPGMRPLSAPIAPTLPTSLPGWLPDGPRLRMAVPARIAYTSRSSTAFWKTPPWPALRLKTA